jgi:hypothetical protein
MNEKVKCDKCGSEYSIGDWPFCTGDPDGHKPAVHFGYDPLDSYVDPDLLPHNDPRCTSRNEFGRKGVLIESRSQRKQLMREQGLQFGSHFSREV